MSDTGRYAWLAVLAVLVLSAVVYPREGALAIILAVCALGLAVGALVFVVRRRHG